MEKHPELFEVSFSKHTFETKFSELWRKGYILTVK